MMFTIKIFILTFILVGLVMKSDGQQSIHDVMKGTCERYFKESIHPTIQFLNLLSTLILKTGKPFTIWKEESTNTDMMGILHEFCSDASERECHFKEMLVKFKASITVREGSIRELLDLQDSIIQEDKKGIISSLKLMSNNNSESYKIDFCENLIQQSVSSCREFCPAISNSGCETVCNNIKTTTKTTPPTATKTTPPTTTTKTTPTTTKTTPTTTTKTTTVTHEDPSLYQEKAKDVFQESTSVIASVISFIAGIFCTIITVFVIRYFRTRHEKSKEERVSASDANLNTKADDNIKKGETTYESLKTRECVAEKASTDHVYLGLNTHSDSNKQRYVTNRYENVSQADVVGKSKHIITEKTEDHVYNALEIKTQSENTYTGLTDKEHDNPQLRDSQEDPGIQNRSSDAHYFILHDEDNGNRCGERKVVGGNVQGQEELGVAENKVDSRKQSQNDYFILEKVEHSDGLSPELLQNNETSADEPEGTYHILEKE